MTQETALAVFENYKIRRVFDEKLGIWLFSVVDIIAVLTDQKDYQTARKYWNKLKERLKKEGSESVTDCHQLKLEAADGKKYLTDVAHERKNSSRKMRMKIIKRETDLRIRFNYFLTSVTIFPYLK